MCSGVGGCDISSHVPQAKTTTDSTDHQKISSSVLINQEDEVDQSKDGLHYAEQTSGEERCVGSSDTDRFEDSWTVIVDCIDARC